MEDGPGDFGVAGAELGEAVEGDVGLEGDGESMLVGGLQGGEEGIVGFCNLAEPGCCVGILAVECRGRARNWGVGGVGVG